MKNIFYHLNWLNYLEKRLNKLKKTFFEKLIIAIAVTISNFYFC